MSQNRKPYLEKFNKENDSRRFHIWYEQSKHDLSAAKTSIASGFHEWACYQAMQSVEKVLKAVIVKGGFRAPRVHKLGVLMGMANQANPKFFDVKIDFRKLESFTFISRYPFVVPGKIRTPHEIVTSEDAKTCIKMAKDILDRVTEFLFDEEVSGKGKLLVTISNHYFTKEEVEKRIEGLKELVRRSEYKIQKIILYGSFSRDLVQPRTKTMDVLIISEIDLDFISRIEYFRDLTKGNFPIVEPLVYTPKEFVQLFEEEGESYLESAIDEGKIIFDGNSK